MEIKQLKTFTMVAKTLSFSKTAEILNFAQSSISDQITTLESELHCKLFERLGRKSTLTNEGECLLNYAEKILILCEEAKQDISGNLRPKGNLRIAIAETLCVFRLPELFQQFSKTHPDVDLK